MQIKNNTGGGFVLFSISFSIHPLTLNKGFKYVQWDGSNLVSNRFSFDPCSTMKVNDEVFS